MIDLFFTHINPIWKVIDCLLLRGRRGVCVWNVFQVCSWRNKLRKHTVVELKELDLIWKWKREGMCDWWEWNNEKVMWEELCELMDEWVKTHTLDSHIHIGCWKWWICVFYAWNTFNNFHSPILTSFHSFLSPSFSSHVTPARTRRHEHLSHHWSKVPFIKEG